VHKLQIAFLHLNVDDDTRAKIGDTRIITNHCKNISTIRRGILASHINYLNKTEFVDQKQLPNPTAINSPGITGEMSCSSDLIIVFTAFLQQKFYSKESNYANEKTNTVE